MSDLTLRDMTDGEDCCRLGRGCSADFCRFANTAKHWYKKTITTQGTWPWARAGGVYHEDIE